MGNNNNIFVGNQNNNVQPNILGNNMMIGQNMNQMQQINNNKY